MVPRLGKLLYRNFQVCEICFSCQTGIAIPTQESGIECYICRGLCKKVNTIASAVQSNSKKHDFRSFLIGLKLPWQICDNEDQLRATNKIRGRESIKTVLTRDIRQRFAELSGKKLEILNPDIVIIVTIEDGNDVDFKVSVRSRSLTLAGVYIKKSRDISIHGSHLSIYSKRKVSTVEEMLRRELIYATEADSVSFCWLGKEDKESLVLGAGRPFFATLKNPKRRYLKHNLRFQIGNVSVTVNRNPTLIPRQLPSFINKIRAIVDCEDNEQISSSDMTVLNKKGILCVGYTNKKSCAMKLIYSMRARVISRRKFTLTLVCDGGLPIKRFVDGYGRTSPNVTDLLNKRCKCHIFDVLDLLVQEHFSKK